jgi:hypothetical protein
MFIKSVHIWILEDSRLPCEDFVLNGQLEREREREREREKINFHK